MNYDGRVFRTCSNSSGGEVGQETLFHYHQRGAVVWATYAGGAVVHGTLLAQADPAGNLEMRYQHISRDGGFKTGRCQSRPEILADGRVRVHERWRWTDGAEGEGESVIEEISAVSAVSDHDGAGGTGAGPSREPEVWVFFYGSYINFAVLREVDLVPGRWEVAKLEGFDIRIAPRANLVASDRDCVWGIVATARPSELARLYAHARDVLGEIYLPALCYIAPEMTPAPPDPAYVDRIVGPARQFGFPAWYIERLTGFLPAAPPA